MPLAYLLTLVALAGVAIGLVLGEKRKVSAHIGAAGGGVLLGLALFWVVPEIAQDAGWVPALVCPGAACGVLVLMDRHFQHHDGEPGEQVIWPLLIATAIHSFLDGWSLRALAGQGVPGLVVPFALGLHKVPEGFAMGWVTRRSIGSVPSAFAAAAGVELFTLVGAFIEPAVNSSGVQRFGAWWTVLVLAVIGGSFAFLGLHTIAPARKRTDVLAVFLLTLLAIGGVAATVKR
jgi:hypothetical protein